MSAAEPHYIDAQRTIAPVDGPLAAPHEYAAVLRSDFVSSYHDGRDVWTDEAAMRPASAILHEHLGSPADVLDAGAGRGRDTAYFLEHGHRVTAVDLVEPPEWAQLSQRWGERVRFVASPVSELQGEAQFDGALDNGCLHHQHPDAYAAYLARVHALLRPEGLFTISVFEADGAGRLYANHAQRLYREFTEPELVELLGAAHFTPVSSHRVPRPKAGLHYLVLTVRKSRPD
ncbi:methyltransferase type 12 [Burkholderia sp. ABCPW 14]|uniref:1,6-didemethyltoxoflavin N1-methyltransferase n=1 Tax=Burkholderia sp. ABCPW 14 TaxID=1637860 RepID=UPI000770D8D9|nr:1,6-didemethyltoxoflavin N1-methyltransferase [Burkholderia sp. ABCPW 14]KVD74025.1 methyltransferase type 12 [Burkholderia sp. ABCPW 14]